MKRIVSLDRLNSQSALFGFSIAIASLVIAIVSVRRTGTIPSDTGVWVALGAALAASALSAAVMLIFQRRARRKRVQQRVFLIYAREDTTAAKVVFHWLQEAGYDVWIDVERILPGQIWQTEISRAIESSEAAVLLISENSTKSGPVLNEVASAIRTLRAKSGDITPLFPIRLDETLPPESLREIQWVDMRAGSARDKLLEGLGLALRPQQ
jgi:hypothetical protein